MRPDAREAFALSFPVFVMVLLAIVLVYHWIKEQWLKARMRVRRRRLGLFASSLILGCAFLPLAVMYRPSLLEVARAQIRQQEGVEEDESGDPESPLKHLLRQLRRIRRGERVETVSLRLK